MAEEVISSVVRRIRTEENLDLFILVERSDDNFVHPWQICVADFSGTALEKVSTFSGKIDQEVVKEWSSCGEHDESTSAAIIRSAILQTGDAPVEVLFSFGKSKDDATVFDFTFKIALDSEGKLKQRMAVVRMRSEPVGVHRFLTTSNQENRSLLTSVGRLSKQNEELRLNCNSELKELERLVGESVKRETNLYKSFMLVLNTKKDRIVQLEAELKSQSHKTELSDEKDLKHDVHLTSNNDEEDEPASRGRKRPGRPKKTTAAAAEEPATKPKTATRGGARGGRVFRRTAQTIKRSESDLQAEAEALNINPEMEVSARRSTRSTANKKQPDSQTTSRIDVTPEVNRMDVEDQARASNILKNVNGSDAESDTDSNATTLSGIELDHAFRTGRRSDSD